MAKMRATATFYKVLRIFYYHLYAKIAPGTLTEEKFVKVFPAEIMNPPKKGVRSTDYYPFSNVGAKHREKLFNGQARISLNAAKIMNMNLTDVTAINPLMRRIEDLQEDDAKVLVNTFRHEGIEGIDPDLESLPYSIMNMVREYISAMARKSEYPCPKGIEHDHNDEVVLKDGILYMNGKEINVSDVATSDFTPAPDSKHEKELIKALGSDSEDDLSQNDRKILDIQRNAYSTAIFRRNNLRDCIEDNVPSYTRIIDAVKQGVMMPYLDDYETPKKRMMTVLNTASSLPLLEASVLCRRTNLIDTANKHGICHILIDEDEEFSEGWGNR